MEKTNIYTSKFMKKWQKIECLKDVDFELFVMTRNQVKEELSERQPMFCCCGKLATGLHEANCKKFNNKVDVEVIKRLQHLLPSKT